MPPTATCEAGGPRWGCEGRNARAREGNCSSGEEDGGYQQMPGRPGSTAAVEAAEADCEVAWGSGEFLTAKCGGGE
jgi:hypothetical protein